jgi:hypothetical protein
MQGRPVTGNRGNAFGMQTPVPQVRLTFYIYNVNANTLEAA